jgi:hypothetical protein
VTTAHPGGWGAGGWGDSPWGTSDSDLELLSVQAVRENVVRLVFDEAPYWSGILDPGDASNVARYAITAVSGVGIDGEPIRPVRVAGVSQGNVQGLAGAAVDVVTDRALSHWPCLYRVAVNGLRSSAGLPLVPGSSLTFYGVQAGPRTELQDQILAGRDLANPQSYQALTGLPNASALPSSVLGTYRPDGTGDYANDAGLTGYVKRITRRLMTRKGAFAHLPDYGVGIPNDVKKLQRPGFRSVLEADAEDQIKQEPETLTCACRVVQVGATTFIQVRTVTKLGPASFDVPVSVR